MKRMPSELRTFIATARDGDEPSAGDRARIHAALQRKLRALGVSELRAPLEGSAAQGAMSAAAGFAGLRLVLLVLAVGALGGAARWWLTSAATNDGARETSRILATRSTSTPHAATTIPARASAVAGRVA